MYNYYIKPMTKYKSYNKSITAFLRFGQYGEIFSSRLQYCPSLRSGQYCQPQTEYFPILPSQSCSNIYSECGQKVGVTTKNNFVCPPPPPGPVYDICLWSMEMVLTALGTVSQTAQTRTACLRECVGNIRLPCPHHVTSTNCYPFGTVYTKLLVSFPDSFSCTCAIRRGVSQGAGSGGLQNCQAT